MLEVKKEKRNFYIHTKLHSALDNALEGLSVGPDFKNDCLVMLNALYKPIRMKLKSQESTVHHTYYHRNYWVKLLGQKRYYVIKQFLISKKLIFITQYMPSVFTTTGLGCMTGYMINHKLMNGPMEMLRIMARVCPEDPTLTESEKDFLKRCKEHYMDNIQKVRIDKSVVLDIHQYLSNYTLKSYHEAGMNPVNFKTFKRKDVYVYIYEKDESGEIIDIKVDLKRCISHDDAYMIALRLQLAYGGRFGIVMEGDKLYVCDMDCFLESKKDMMLSAYQYSIECINGKSNNDGKGKFFSHTYGRNSTNNRVDSNLTNMFGLVKEKLYFEKDGIKHRLVSLDTKCSQFAILANMMVKDPNYARCKDVQRFYRLSTSESESLDIYTYIQKRLGLPSRKDAKGIGFTVLFKWYSMYDVTPEYDMNLFMFKSIFPNVFDYIYKRQRALKKENDGLVVQWLNEKADLATKKKRDASEKKKLEVLNYKIANALEDRSLFPVSLQRAEAKFFIDGVFRKCMDAGLSVFTVHDEIMAMEADIEKVHGIYLQTCKEMNVRYHLRTKGHAASPAPYKPVPIDYTRSKEEKKPQYKGKTRKYTDFSAKLMSCFTSKSVKHSSSVNYNSKVPP